MIGEDWSTFFNTAEFAMDATLDGVAVRGIFDNTSMVAQGGMGMATTNPTFVLPTGSVPDAPVGKLLVIGAITYSVAAHEPDGTGVSVLVLERTS